MNQCNHNTEEANYRDNVGIMIINRNHQILAGEAIRYKAKWEMPQGGIDRRETPNQAMQRELFEETGISMAQVQLIHEHEDWLRYLFRKPKYKDDIYYIGQRQKWFLLEYNGPLPDATSVKEQEFRRFDWVEPAWLVAQVPVFKKQVYTTVLGDFEPLFPG